MQMELFCGVSLLQQRSFMMALHLAVADAVAEFPLLLDETDCIFHSEE